MKLTASILLLYVGFIAGSLQAMAFPDKWEGLGVIIMVTIILLIAGIARARSKRKVKPIKKRSSVVRKRSAKSKSRFGVSS